MQTTQGTSCSQRPEKTERKRLPLQQQRRGRDIRMGLLMAAVEQAAVTTQRVDAAPRWGQLGH